MASQSRAFRREFGAQPQRFVEAVAHFAQHVLAGEERAQAFEAHGGADPERDFRFRDAAPDDETARQLPQGGFGQPPRFAIVGRDGMNDAGAALTQRLLQDGAAARAAVEFGGDDGEFGLGGDLTFMSLMLHQTIRWMT